MLEVSLIRSTNGAPSRKGCVLDGQMIDGKQEMSTAPPPITGMNFRPKQGLTSQRSKYVGFGDRSVKDAPLGYIYIYLGCTYMYCTRPRCREYI